MGIGKLRAKADPPNDIESLPGTYDLIIKKPVAVFHQDDDGDLYSDGNSGGESHVPIDGARPPLRSATRFVGWPNETYTTRGLGDARKDDERLRTSVVVLL